MRIQLRMLDSKSRGARRGEGAGAGTGTGGGRPARRSTSIPCRINAAFLLFALFMSAGRCMASIFDAPPPFNVTTQSGYSAPMCTRLCYPWPTAVFSDHKTPVLTFNCRRLHREWRRWTNEVNSAHNMKETSRNGYPAYVHIDLSSGICLIAYLRRFVPKMSPLINPSWPDICAVWSCNVSWFYDIYIFYFHFIYQAI